MALTHDLKKLTDASYAVVTDEANKLYADLKQISPVDTNFFRSSWSNKKLSVTSWRISNSAKYADVLARGRRFVNNRYEGSLQWEHGLSPMLQKTSKNIEGRTNAIKY